MERKERKTCFFTAIFCKVEVLPQTRGATANFGQGNFCGALPQYILIINIDSYRKFYDLSEIKQKLEKLLLTHYVLTYVTNN